MAPFYSLFFKKSPRKNIHCLIGPFFPARARSACFRIFWRVSSVGFLKSTRSPSFLFTNSEGISRPKSRQSFSATASRTKSRKCFLRKQSSKAASNSFGKLIAICFEDFDIGESFSLSIAFFKKRHLTASSSLSHNNCRYTTTLQKIIVFNSRSSRISNTGILNYILHLRGYIPRHGNWRIRPIDH